MKRILSQGAQSVRPLTGKEVDAVSGGVDVSNCIPLLDVRGGYWCPGIGNVPQEDAWLPPGP